MTKRDPLDILRDNDPGAGAPGPDSDVAQRVLASVMSGSAAGDTTSDSGALDSNVTEVDFKAAAELDTYAQQDSPTAPNSLRRLAILSAAAVLLLVVGALAITQLNGTDNTEGPLDTAPEPTPTSSSLTPTTTTYTTPGFVIYNRSSCKEGVDDRLGSYEILQPQNAIAECATFWLDGRITNTEYAAPLTAPALAECREPPLEDVPAAGLWVIPVRAGEDCATYGLEPSPTVPADDPYVQLRDIAEEYILEACHNVDDGIALIESEIERLGLELEVELFREPTPEMPCFDGAREFSDGKYRVIPAAPLAAYES